MRLPSKVMLISILMSSYYDALELTLLTVPCAHRFTGYFDSARSNLLEGDAPRE